VAKALDCLALVGGEAAGLIDNLSTLICPGCGESVDIGDREATLRLAESMSIPFLGSLPMEPAAAKAADLARKPLVEAAPDSRLAQAITSLSAKL
jgi:ATP-binding protein involved in chromosome partitioning